MLRCVVQAKPAGASVVVFDAWCEEVLHVCSTVIEGELHREWVILAKSNFHSFQWAEDLGHWHEVGEGVLAASRVRTFKRLELVLVEGNGDGVG